MVRAFADGEDRHRLEDVNGRNIGWIVRRAIGFQGFATESVAMRAALDSWHALEAALNREYAGRPKREVLADRLHVVQDGSREWISDGHVRLAQLQRRPDDDAGAAAFAIELQLPTYATEGVAIAAAQVVARAIRDHLVDPRLAEVSEEATA